MAVEPVWAVKWVGAGLASALLPPPYRDDLRRRYGVLPGRWSFWLGLAEFWGGGVLWVIGLFWFVQSGRGTALAWCFSPLGLLVEAVAGMGIARCIVYAAVREALGNPLLTLVLASRRGGRVRREARARARELGPWRSDRVEWLAEGGLVVLASREKPDWNERVTIVIEDRLYRVAAVEERPDGPWVRIAYRLRPLGENEIVRCPTHYRPPARNVEM